MLRGTVWVYLVAPTGWSDNRMTATNDELELELLRLFPNDRCVAAVAELNAWTSVQAILSAARHLEGRSLPTDQLESGIIIEMRLGPVFEWIFLRVFRWMHEGYAVPAAKIDLARALDSAITDDTASRLREARFSPTISTVPVDQVGGHEAAPSDTNLFVFADDPFIIEMVQDPLNCLMDILTFSFGNAARMRELQNEALELTGGKPNIFHRAYSDSRLYAMLEAFCYHVFDFPLGMREPLTGQAIDRSYRSVNVQGRPPVVEKNFNLARRLMEEMLDDLR